MGADQWLRLVQILVAAVGIAAAVVTLWQKKRADNRAEWWRRYTWATEQSFEETEHQQLVGWVNLGILSQSQLATKTERDVVQALALDKKGRDND
ncbi:hypothetical protein [Corynebacterium variabile]|uniref:hypothetical protein n=1 Tax=Corynebacterium variabile TaxID=1727 RepID=UPI001D3E6232|nr:hypothetical protein [Corynebacterium variabile]HJG47096.1 hypothetical protein [Corynebacterium variabile]